jgi:hypothetical protein
MPLTAAASGSTTLLVRWRRTGASPGRLSATARILASIIHARGRVWCVRLAGRLWILFVGSGNNDTPTPQAASSTALVRLIRSPAFRARPRRWHEDLGSLSR